LGIVWEAIAATCCGREMQTPVCKQKYADNCLRSQGEKMKTFLEYVDEAQKKQA